MGPPPAAAMPKARTGLVLLLALLVELVVIAGIGNQWVSDKLVRHDNGSLGERGAVNVALVYSWRFSPRGGHDPGHFFLAQMIGLAVAIIVSLLLILAVVRGPISFGRAFFGAWMSVTVAAMVGGYVRGLIVDPGFGGTGQGNVLVRSLFGITAPGSVVFVAGVVLGFIVALVVGIVAPLTRRKPQPGWAPMGTAPMGPMGPGAPEPQAGRDDEARGQEGVAPVGPPWQDRYYGPPQRSEGTGSSAYRPGEHGADDQRTTALPSLSKDDDAGSTSRLPAQGDEAGDRTQHLEPSGPREQQRAEPPAEQQAAHPPQQQTTGQQPEQQPEQQTTQLPRGPEGEQPPTQWSAGAPGAPGSAPGGPSTPGESPGSHPTAQFPRPPDDEDMDPERR